MSVGVETPVVDNGLSRKEKIEKIEGHFDQIVSTLGLDLKDDSLTDTPKRVAKMYVNEIFWGLDYDAFPKATVVENKMQYNEMVVEKGVSVQSYCEHHFVNIDGLATVAYVPNKKVLGLSKMNRIVEYFSRRPQIQERLTEQIYHALSFILETENVAVMIDAKHFCVKSRGVEDTQCSTVTSRLGGSFKAHPEVRAEFLALLKM
ncbi:GTP cyclohydrolase I FolE [Gammaproteobacteria bacterium]|nr:GTP cyclohydrolase I FolE [Gammaproteobacteria bacterium]